MGFHRPADLRASDLAVLGWQTQHLMARGLNGAGFMDLHMGGFRAQNTLVGPQSGCDHRQIGLGASHQKMHRQIIPEAKAANFLRRPGAIGIHAITGSLLHIGFGQCAEHSAMTAFAVIVIKIDHRKTPVFFFHNIPFPASCQERIFSFTLS